MTVRPSSHSLDVTESANLNFDSTTEKIKVLMLGPSLNHQGGMASVEKLLVQHINHDIDVQHLSTYEEGSVLQRFWIFQMALYQLLGKLWKKEVDVIHVHFSERASVFRAAIWILLARQFRKPIVMHSHGCDFHTFYEALPQFVQSVINWAFQKASCFITLSQSWQDYYINQCQLSPENVVTLINPVKLPPQVPDRRNVQIVSFVCLGRVGQRKGSFDLLRAFAKLSIAQQQNARLLLAGNGEVEEAQQLAERLGIADHVECLGWLSAEDCNQLLEKSDVFVLPSYAEGLPMAILEAMGWGLPVLSTPVGGIPEVLISHQNGILVNPGNVQELTEAMEILLENEDLRISFGKAARQKVEPLNIEGYRARLRNIYRNLHKGLPVQDLTSL